MDKHVDRTENILTKYVNPEDFISTTMRNVVVETGANHSFNPRNPDPTMPFPGKDGKWYRIDFPKGTYNCYMFALGWTIPVGNRIGYGLPGILYGYLPETKEDCLNFMLEDLRILGRDVHEIYYGKIPKRLPKAEEGTYWVKIYFTKEDDGIGSFHVSRKDEKSGRWVHKPGWFTPCKVVCNNLKFGDVFFIELKNNPRFQEMINGLSEEDLKEFISAIGFGMSFKEVTESRLENRDDATYKAYDPQVDDSNFIYYRPYAVLRIDE